MNIKIKSIWQVNSTEKSQNNVPFARAYILESTGLSTSQWELLYGFRVGPAISQLCQSRALRVPEEWLKLSCSHLTVKNADERPTQHRRNFTTVPGLSKP